MKSFLAKDNGIKLENISDALTALSLGLPALIFTQDDISPDFFDLKNKIAGEVFQKFANYSFKAAFVIPKDHNYGERVTELIREHHRHPLIRFFTSIETASGWLAKL